LYGGFVSYVVIRNKPVDFYVYYLAAYGFAEGADVYGIGRDFNPQNQKSWEGLAASAGVQIYSWPYRYPPLAAELVWPLTRLRPRAAALVWEIASAVALIGSAWMLGRSTSLSFGVPLALGLLLLSVPALATLHAGQINGFVLFTIAAAMLNFARHREASAGVWLATGTMLKIFPVAYLGYFVWRGRPRVVLIGMLTVVIWLALAIPLVGFHGLVSYAHNFLALLQPSSLYIEGANQSLPAFLLRLATRQSTWAAADKSRWMIWIVAFICLSIAAVTALLCMPVGELNKTFQLEFGLLTAAISLVPSLVLYHQLVMLLVPTFVLAERVLGGSAPRWVLVAAAFCIVAIDVHGLFWHHFESNRLLVSMPCYATAILWAVLAWLIAHEKFWPDFENEQDGASTG
jgi:hypothetical protein